MDNSDTNESNRVSILSFQCNLELQAVKEYIHQSKNFQPLIDCRSNNKCQQLNKYQLFQDVAQY